MQTLEFTYFFTLTVTCSKGLEDDPLPCLPASPTLALPGHLRLSVLQGWFTARQEWRV